MIIRECKHDKRQGNKDSGQSARVAALTNEEAIAYSASYYRELERESAIRFAVNKAVEKAEVKAEAKGRAEGEAKGRAEGEAKGRAEGEAEKNLENARNFKLLGVDPAIIAKATGLSIEEIENL